jgi:tRNA(Ile)-lysidine synthase TilS/MesJ
MQEIKLEKSILGEAKKVNALYGLVQKGDKILVGLSGGKDSIAMVHLLKYYQEKLRMDFEFKVVVIHYGSSDENEPLEKLQKYFAEFGIEIEIFKTNLKEIIEKKQNKNKSICSFVARMRRGMLNKKALDWGANKLALGQHLDDAVETLFMSLTYSGRLSSMPPKYQAENKLEVIRPLI